MEMQVEDHKELSLFTATFLAVNEFANQNGAPSIRVIWTVGLLT